MFVSTILVTVAFSAINSYVSLLGSVRENIVAANPIPIQYLSFEGNEEKEQKDTEFIEDKLQEYGVGFQAYRYVILEYGDWEMTANKLISQTDYDHETGKRTDLPDGQAMDISGEQGRRGSVNITDTISLTVVGENSPILDSSRRKHTYVVNDTSYSSILESGKMKQVTAYDYTVDDEGQRAEVRAAAKEMRAAIGIGGYRASFMFNPRIESLDIREYTYQLETYISVLLSVIFMLASASLQYFRLLNQAKENLPMEKNLYRFGLSVRRILGIQRRQMLSVFLLPIGFGVLSTFFAMNYLVNMQVASVNIFRQTAIVSALLILLELLYFFIMDRQFEKKIKRYLLAE